jgi:membrane associated rhomboid family serine protease
MSEHAYRPPTAFSVMPPVLKNLLVINVIIYIAQLGPFGDFLISWFALWPYGTQQYININLPAFYPWQLVTSAFLHSPASFMHILFNMFILWMFGMRIENLWGSRRFLIYYFACVLGASLLQLIAVSAPFIWPGIWTPTLGPTLGASGGVLGVLLAFGMMYPNEPIYLYFLVPIKAKYLVIGFAALDLFAGVTGSQVGVANFAHLGGMLTGFLLILYWRAQSRRRYEQRMA